MATSPGLDASAGAGAGRIDLSKVKTTIIEDQANLAKKQIAKHLGKTVADLTKDDLASLSIDYNKKFKGEERWQVGTANLWTKITQGKVNKRVIDHSEKGRIHILTTEVYAEIERSLPKAPEPPPPDVFAQQRQVQQEQKLQQELKTQIERKELEATVAAPPAAEPPPAAAPVKTEAPSGKPQVAVKPEKSDEEIEAEEKINQSIEDEFGIDLRDLRMCSDKTLMQAIQRSKEQIGRLEKRHAGIKDRDTSAKQRSKGKETEQTEELAGSRAGKMKMREFQQKAHAEILKKLIGEAVRRGKTNYSNFDLGQDLKDFKAQAAKKGPGFEIFAEIVAILGSEASTRGMTV